MSKCSQCGNNALYNYSGNMLCLNCYHKIKQIEYVDWVRTVSSLNYTIDEMDSMMGMSFNSPKHYIPAFPEFLQQSSPKSYQYINVQDSAVGSINTGNIENIDVSMSNLLNSGNDKIAEYLKEFTETVINNNEIVDKMKNELLEQISFISSQISLQKEKRKNGLVKPILTGIYESIKGIASLITIWDKLYTLISPYFN